MKCQAMTDENKKDNKANKGKIKERKRRRRKIFRGKTLIGIGKGITGAGKAVTLGGKGIKAVGKALSAAGKVLTNVAKAIRQAGQAVLKSGLALIKGGAAACATVAGAIAGVPMILAGTALVAAGAATIAASIPITVAGIALNVAGRGVQIAGNLMQKLGKAIQKPGNALQKRGQEICRSAGKEVSIDIPQQSNSKDDNSNIIENVADLAAIMALSGRNEVHTKAQEQSKGSPQQQAQNAATDILGEQPRAQNDKQGAVLDPSQDDKLQKYETVNTLAAKTGRGGMAANSSKQIRNHITRTQGKEGFDSYREANIGKHPEWQPKAPIHQTTLSPQIMSRSAGRSA